MDELHNDGSSFSMADDATDDHSSMDDPGIDRGASSTTVSKPVSLAGKQNLTKDCDLVELSSDEEDSNYQDTSSAVIESSTVVPTEAETANNLHSSLVSEAKLAEETASLSGFSGSTIDDDDEHSVSSLNDIVTTVEMSNRSPDDVTLVDSNDAFDDHEAHVSNSENDKDTDATVKNTVLRSRKQVFPTKGNEVFSTEQFIRMNGGGVKEHEDEAVASEQPTVESPGKEAASLSASHPPSEIIPKLEDDEEMEEEEVDDDTAELEDVKTSVGKNICHLDHKLGNQVRRMTCLDCGVLICPICFYDTGSSMGFHFRNGDDDKEHCCSVCMLILESECALKAHERLHFADGHPKRLTAPYVCPYCGYKYVQKNFFLQHSLLKCTHLNMIPQFECGLCVDGESGIICGLEGFREHQTSRHTYTAFRCTSCDDVLVKSKVDALLHAKETHGVPFHSWSLVQCGIKRIHYCEYCDEEVEPDHLNTMHKPEPVLKPAFACACGFVAANIYSFRRHRVKCPESREVPPHWKSLLLEDLESSEDDANDESGSTLSKEEDDAATNERSVRKECVDCAAEFFEEDKEQCKGCQEFQRDAAFTNYNGLEQIVGEKVESFGTCEIQYDSSLQEHDYGRRHDFLSNVVPEMRQQRKKFTVPFFKAAGVENNAWNSVVVRKPKSTAEDGQGVVCCVCDAAIADSCDDLLESTIEHFMLFHYNATIPLKVPHWLKKTKPYEAADPEPDPPQPKKKKNKQSSDKDCLPLIDRVLKESADAKAKASASPLPNKNVNGTPKSHKKKVIPISNAKSDPIEEESGPAVKEHEFWDKINEALTTAENKKRTKEQLPSCSNRRQVKKPKRYASESDESGDERATPAKEKTQDSPPPSKSNPAAPEETVKKPRPSRVDSLERSNSSEGEHVAAVDSTEGRVLNPRRKRKKGDDFDPDIERLKVALKTDKEMGFIAKTFDSSGAAQSANKRRLKPSSKLRYNQLLTEPAPAPEPPSSVEPASDDLPYKKQTCCICNVKYETRMFFLAHIRTHRTDENTFQCMECGECFVIRSTLEKHLHFFHKIKHPDIYIRENAKKEQRLVEKLPHQCSVCRLVCQSSSDLSKHFRIHGTAFLKEVKSAKT